ncbi:ATP-binding protein [Reyranella soli]|uniref:Transcriptional regulator n=1 Tax=Reyranella soli TaxID=1230389 RepID=A0A512NF19_9HYPH|nr:winged helix-turn-helix domain-containing protein [Reyranella soli]GEP57538.1 transcriptional regulator [Reyranella soli]
MDRGAAGSRGSVAFGPFRLHADKRLLEKNGVPVAVGSRALDLLIALVEHAGEVVSKQDLMARVWPKITVDESSLRVHVAMLRKALGDGRDGARYVTNVSGRGYCLVAPVTAVVETPAVTAAPPAAAKPAISSVSATSPDPPPGLPRPLGHMVGREATVADVSALLATQRFVTLHGPGGIGKTTVAIAVAHAGLAAFANAVTFVDLGAISDASLLPSAVASALGVAVQSGDAMPTVLNFLRRRRLLLVLDNCEHVIDQAARLAEPVFRDCPEVGLLATSREALRVEGEHVFPLPALETPDRDKLGASEVMAFAAANLFVERAAASGHPVELSDADAAIVAEICRKLDGNALAIELAAGRVGTHGLQGLATLLDSRLRLSWQGRRTALPRHQTLSATLDWSYNLIPETERAVLRRLSILLGGFTLRAAEAVASDASFDPAAVVEALEQLVAKSLVQADASGTPRYRLLDTMRAYARSKLAESGEERTAARRHADYFRTFLEQTRAERTQALTPSDGNRRLERASLLGNVRAALDWCFAGTGERALGVQLAAAAAPLFIEVSLLDECRRWSERALGVLEETERGTRFEMELQAGLGHSLMLTSRNSEEAGAALERGLEIATALGDRFNQVRLLNRLHLYYRRIGEVARTLAAAERMEKVAGEIGDPVGRAAAHILLGVSHHLGGDQARARFHLDTCLAEAAGVRPTDPGHFAFYRPPRIPLTRILWLQGHLDQALEMAGQIARTPLADDDPVTSCIGLIWGASVHGWAGDWALVEQQAERLIAHATAHFLEPYRNVGQGMRGEALVHGGDVEEGTTLLRRSIASLEADRYWLYTPGFSATLATALVSTGQVEQAVRVIDGVIDATETLGGLLILPELLRIKGEICAGQGDERQARSLFRRALVLAEQQSALFWQLRVAMSLMRLAGTRSQRDAARELLADTYGRFTEGFATADLKAAKALLN